MIGANDDYVQVLGYDFPAVCVTQSPTEKVAMKQGVRKRSRGSDVWAISMNEMAKAFGSFFEDTKGKMADVAQRIGFDHDMATERRKVNGELTQLLTLSKNERLKAASMIVNHPHRVDLFFSLPDDEKEDWVRLLLAGEI